MILIGLVWAILDINSAFAQVHVRGYTRSNGTYVAPHVRTSPNNTKTDNYSYPGNYNPNTGKTSGTTQTSGIPSTVGSKMNTPGYRAYEYHSTGRRLYKSIKSTYKATTASFSELYLIDNSAVGYHLNIINESLKVDVVGKTDNDYLVVNYQGKEGYIHQSQISNLDVGANSLLDSDNNEPVNFFPDARLSANKKKNTPKIAPPTGTTSLNNARAMNPKPVNTAANMIISQTIAGSFAIQIDTSAHTLELANELEVLRKSPEIRDDNILTSIPRQSIISIYDLTTKGYTLVKYNGHIGFFPTKAIYVPSMDQPGEVTKRKRFKLF